MINPSDNILKEYKITTPSVIIYKLFDDPMVILSSDKFSSLEDFILSHQFPLLDEIKKENSDSYIKSGIPIAFLFVETQEHREKFTPILKDIAKETRRKLNFVFIDWEKYGSQSNKLGLTQGIVPAFTIENTTSQDHYAFDEQQELSATNIRNFVFQFIKGELKPTLVSAPLPTENNEAVKTVVALNFQDIVFDTKKDVFIEFYAPWCGHCKQLKPIWDELAESLREVEFVTIAKMDVTANDLQSGLQINSFPSIYLYKANDKKNPVIYQQRDRSYSALLQFLKENASHSINVSETKNKDEL